MPKSRGNPFTGDAPAPKSAWKAKTSNKAVMVTAHARKRPVRSSESAADNAFEDHKMPDKPEMLHGLVGEPQVNHLKAAIGLMGRKRV